MTFLALTVLLSAATAPLSAEVHETSTATATFANLIAELKAIEQTLTTTTSTAALLSEEGREMQTATASAASVASGPFERVSEGPPPAHREEAIRLVFTGRFNGLGVDRYRFDLPERLDRLLTGRGGLSRVQAHHGVLVQRSSLLVAPDGRASSLIDFFAGGSTEPNVACDLPEEAWSVLSGAERLILPVGEEWQPASAAPWWLRELAKTGVMREFERRRCRAGGHQAFLYSPASDEFRPPSWRLSDFEFRR